MNDSDRRREPRHQMVVPLSVADAVGYTTDVSASGVRFEFNSLITPGSVIEFELALNGMSVPVQVRCLGRVVRVEARGFKTYIAATIESMNFSDTEH